MAKREIRIFKWTLRTVDHSFIAVNNRGWPYTVKVEAAHDFGTEARAHEFSRRMPDEGFIPTALTVIIEYEYNYEDD